MRSQTRWSALLSSALVLVQCALAPTRHLGPVTCLAVSDQGEVYSCSQAGVHVGTGDAQRLFCDPPFRALGLACTRDGAQVLVCGGEAARRGVLALYSASGRLVREATLGDDLVHSIALLEARSLVLAACADGRVVALAFPSLDDPHEKARHGSAATAVVGRDAWASAGRDGLLYLGADVDAPAVANSDHSAPVQSLCEGPAPAGPARWWSGARDGKVRLHEGTRLLRTWQRLGSAVRALAPHREPGLVYAGLGNGALVRLGPEATTLEVVARWPDAVTALARAGDELVVASGGGVTRWPTSASERLPAPPRDSHARTR